MCRDALRWLGDAGRLGVAVEGFEHAGESPEVVVVSVRSRAGSCPASFDRRARPGASERKFFELGFAERRSENR